MKKIGFIDYYISEWHANNYPAWIAEASRALGYEYEVGYVYAEEYASPVDKRNTDEWCAEYGVERCLSISELCERSDAVIILAPSNPEKHLQYASEAFKHAKPTYVDKTFAEDYVAAEKIFELSKRYGTPFFSSSALRYSSALDGLNESKYVTTLGGGSNFAEYAVHQAEMIVATLGAQPLEVKVEAQGRQYVCSVRLDQGKSATAIYSPALPYAIAAEDENGNCEFREARGGHFQALISDILRFFETRETSFDIRETLSVIRLREAMLRATQMLGEWMRA